MIKNIPLVNKLIADEIDKSHNRQTILHRISEEGLTGLLEFLFKFIRSDKDLNANLMAKADHHIATAMELALWGNHDKLFEQLLLNGLELDPDIFKKRILKFDVGNPLIYACCDGRIKIDKIILNRIHENRNRLGVDFEDKFLLDVSWSGSTVLHVAAAQGEYKIVNFLLNWEHLKENTRKELILKSIKDPLMQKTQKPYYTSQQEKAT